MFNSTFIEMDMTGENVLKFNNKNEDNDDSHNTFSKYEILNKNALNINYSWMDNTKSLIWKYCNKGNKIVCR